MTATPDEAQPLITACCTRCYRVAAKYWQRGGRGYWFTPNELDLPGLPKGASLAYMVAVHPCRCEPPPVLPEGDELAELLARAHAKRSGRRHGMGMAPITIRV